MLNYFSKLLNVRPEEWPRLALLYLMHFIYITTLVWAELILEASFLQQIGVENLKWFFIAKAILSVPGVALYSVFADRINNDKLLIGIVLMGSAVITLGLFLLQQGLTFIAYPLLYVTIFVPFYEIYATHFFTYANGFYDTRSAKRIIPIISTSISAAGVFGGLTMPILNYWLSPMSIILVWLMGLMTVAILTLIIPFLLKEARPVYTPSPITADRLSYIDNLREGYRYVLDSTFLRWMAMSWFCLSLLLGLIHYQVGSIFLVELKSVEEISNLTGKLTSLSNIVIFSFQSLLLSRVMARIGLGNTNLIFPTATLFIANSLIFWPNLITASLGFINRTEFAAMHSSTNSLLYNAVPLRIKGRVRIFINGAIVPFGPLIVGLLLSLPFFNASVFVPILIGILALLYVASEWQVRNEYSRALLKMLEEEDFSAFLSQDATKLTITDTTALNSLQKKLADSPNHEFTIFMANLIGQVGGAAALPILIETTQTTREARTRAALLDVLATLESRDNTLIKLLSNFTEDTDEHVRLSAITGLAQLLGVEDVQFLHLAERMLSDTDVEVRVQTLINLTRRPDFYELPTTAQALNQLRHSNDAHHRARGVQVLGQLAYHLTHRTQTGITKTIYDLTMHFFDASDEVRLQAITAIEEISKNKLPEKTAELIIQQISSLATDPVERIREAVLNIYGQLAPKEAHVVLLPALTDSSPQVRQTATNTLVEIGKPIISIVHAKLDSHDSQLRKMTSIILCRINPQEFSPLVMSYLRSNLLNIYSNHARLDALIALENFRSVRIMRHAWREKNQQLLEEIFYLLSAIHPPKTIQLIAHALKNSEKRIRSNAIEALEGLTSPETANLIGQLYETSLVTTQLLKISQTAWGIETMTATRVITEMMRDNENTWSRGMAIFALGEIAATLKPAAPPLTDKTASPPITGDESLKPRRARRPNPLDLLGNPETPKAEPPKVEVIATPPPILPPSFNLSFVQIEQLISEAFDDPNRQIRLTARAAQRLIHGVNIITLVSQKEGILLSVVEKIIFLKGIPFFQGMTIDQLSILANVCEEQFFPVDTRIIAQEEPGGTLYVVVSGRVGIEQEKRKGSFARLATIEAHSYFGESNLFDNSPHIASAIALQDTLTLRLRREPLIALARQYPELSLKLINVLSERLREANDRVAELTRTKPRELHKLYDQFD